MLAEKAIISNIRFKQKVIDQAKDVIELCIPTNMVYIQIRIVRL